MLDFQRSTETFITEIRMRYAKFVILLSIPGGGDDINQKESRKKRNVSLAFGFSNENPS